MKIRGKKEVRAILLIISVVLLIAGGFVTGIGIQQTIENVQIRNEYKNSELKWKNELAQGMEEEAARDIRNQSLTENMKYVSIERQIVLEDGDSKGEARLTNRKESNYSFTITLIRDATGEIVYESGIIDPGFYIESIQLSSNLKKGYYPCTAVWNFYTKDDEYAGETAWNIVLIIKN